MKTIGILIPTYNEEDNVEQITAAIKSVFETELEEYDYNIVFIDNNSTDNTQDKLRQMASGDQSIGCIFNTRNFSAHRSSFHGILQVPGDAIVLMCADFQDPPALIPNLVSKWASGKKVVMARKMSTDEGLIIKILRSCYYKTLSLGNPMYSKVQNCTGFGIYDRTFINALKQIHDPNPFFRGIVAEITGNIDYVSYNRPKRLHGKSKMGFWSLWDEGVVGLINNSKIFIRIITAIGFSLSLLSFCGAVTYLILKILYWSHYPVGIGPLLILQFLFIGFLMMFIGIVGEYIGAIYEQVLARPRVSEEQRINLPPKPPNAQQIEIDSEKKF